MAASEGSPVWVEADFRFKSIYQTNFYKQIWTLAEKQLTSSYHRLKTIKHKHIMEEKTMAVKIRLRRMGQKKAPFYRIIVADSRSPRDGRFIEEIGTYDPNQNPSAIHVNEELAKKWLANGAQPTDVVAKIFKVAGIEK